MGPAAQAEDFLVLGSSAGNHLQLLRLVANSGAVEMLQCLQGLFA